MYDKQFEQLKAKYNTHNINPAVHNPETCEVCAEWRKATGL